MLASWRRKRDCFHHDYKNNVTWIKSRLIDTGRRKEFWCINCQKSWYI